jgi:hypothetical protein
MSSSASEISVPDRSRRRAADVFLVWNRRLHFYLGLYLLFFGWLFALTGLLLNHSTWEFAQFWPSRVQSSTVQEFREVDASGDLARARDLMQQFGVVGEIQWPAAQPAGGPFTFQVTRPGRTVEVKADLATGRATLQRTELNAWGVLHVLHTFTGLRAADSVNRRDWVLTTVWALSMDAVAAGLVMMVITSYFMWYQLKTKRRGGIVALILGLLSCGVFVAGLRWLM